MINFYMYLLCVGWKGVLPDIAPNFSKALQLGVKECYAGALYSNSKTTLKLNCYDWTNE